MTESTSLPNRFIGRVADRGQAEDAFAESSRLWPLTDERPAGSWHLFELESGAARPDGETLAEPGSALADLYALAARRRLQPLHGAAVMRETAAVVADPGITDPTLRDLTELPFVTIDEVHSKDLDQAVYVERREGGTRVWYAIADPAWCVRPGSALFDEALARGATYYLPGLVIPMLPRELSEGIVSLNPGVDRRAMVFEVELDREGRVETTRIHRARVRSRVKTSYDAVQAFYDGAPPPGAEPAETGRLIAESLERLAEVGQQRLALAESRDIVAIRRQEVAVGLADHQGLRFIAMADPRLDVERYNEQISLLCNIEGARFLLRGDTSHDGIQPVFRLHDPPTKRRLAELAQQIEAIVRLRGLDEAPWRWRHGQQSLADYLRGLPENGPHVRVARSIHRQAMLVGGRSMFADVPGAHYGVGAEVYGRFTAPMREVVGIFAHQETWQKLGLAQSIAGAPEVDGERLSQQVVEVANRSRQTQRELDKEVNRHVLDQLFGDDLKRAPDDRPWRQGTVLGISRSKVHVGLDDPPIDVKVYIHHLQKRQSQRIAQGRDGMTLRNLATGDPVNAVGDAVAVRVAERDAARDRWRLELG
ncbi:MAG: RNB domain-containing ribonuclease [Acidobacteriota bacterium]